ncbi:MAG: aromatic-ring-hydroxylating dioxygenase subunit beta [Cycloclasticus sp.]
MSEIEADVIFSIENLNRDYICALDKLDMNKWLACFNKQGTYTLISNENERNGLPIAFMLDDCYERLQDRVTQVVDIQEDSTEHYQTRHMTQLTNITDLGDNRYKVDFNFTTFYTQDLIEKTDLLGAGRYEDIILVENGKASFIQRKAVLDTNVLPRYVAYPI